VTRSYDLIWGVGIALGVMAAALHYPINDRETLRPGPMPVPMPVPAIS